MEAIDRLVHYPLAYIGAGETIMLQSFPASAATLRSQKQWHSTADLDVEVVGISADKAHVILPHTPGDFEPMDR